MFSVWFYIERHLTPSRETGPTELLSRKPHPTSQHQVATALNPVWEHLCFTCAHSFYVSTSRMCPQVPASLLYAALAYEGLPRSTLLSDSGETWTGHCRWDLPSPASTRPSSGHHASFSNSVNYPAFHPCVNSPYFTSLLLLSVGKLTRIPYHSFFLGRP